MQVWPTASMICLAAALSIGGGRALAVDASSKTTPAMLAQTNFAPVPSSRKQHCPQCNSIASAVSGYQKVIADQNKALVEGQKEVERLKYEREQLKAKLKSLLQFVQEIKRGQLTSLQQKEVYEKAIHKLGQEIAAQLALNKKLGDEIEKSKKYLAQVSALYQQCLNSACKNSLSTRPPTAAPAR